MAQIDELEVTSESPELEFTIAPDELALLEDFTTEGESATLNVGEHIENDIKLESTGHKSTERDALLNVPTTTTPATSNVAENVLSQKKTFVPITFEPFKPTEKSEDTSSPVRNNNSLSYESLRPPGEDSEFVQAVSGPIRQEPQPVTKAQDMTPIELLPPGETSETKSICLEKLKPICLVSPATSHKTQSPVVNNYVVQGGYQPPTVNNLMQHYHGPSPMDYSAHFTPFASFSEPCFLPQTPLYCPPPLFPDPMLMCAMPEPMPAPQRYNTGHYAPPAYSTIFSTTPQLDSFMSAVNTHIMPPPLPQHIVSIQPPTIPQPTLPPPISLPALSTASIVAVSIREKQSLETAPQKSTAEIKENESRFIVSFSNIYRFIHHAEFRKLVAVCGPLKYFKYHPPVIGGDAQGSAEACFTNRQSALRAKRLLLALTIGGAQITTSSPASLVDTNALSDSEKTKDVECMVAISNLLQAASRVFNWDNKQYQQKSTLALSVKPENKPLPENKPALQKKDAMGGGRNNLIRIRLGADIQTKLNTPPPPIVTQMPTVTGIAMPATSSLTPNTFPPLSIAAWVHSLNCPQPTEAPKPVPAPVLLPQTNFTCSPGQQSSSSSGPPQQNSFCKSDNDQAVSGDKLNNKTILANIEAINKQISERKERINKQLEKVYAETSQIKKHDEYCVRVEGLHRLAIEDLQRSCNAAHHFMGTEAMFLLPDSDRACLLQHLLHRHRLLDARVRAELLNCKVLTINTNPALKAQYMRNVQQALTVHEEEARKSLVNDLDLVIDVYKYKMKKCSTPRCSDSGCLYFHNASDYRRDPLIFNYRPEFCPDWPQCKESVRCGLCHTEVELRVHPKLFLSEVCRNGTRDDSGCPHPPGSCFKAHPKSPEMLFHPEWQDLYVKGLRNTYLFVAAAVRSMHTMEKASASKVRVLAVFPCEALVESALQLLASTAQRHLVRVVTVTNKNTEHQDASVLLGTVSALVSLVRRHGCTPFSDLRVLVVDDLPSVIEEPKMLDDFVCFISLLYRTLAKSGCQQSLQRVIVAQEISDEEVAAARALLSTNFLLVTRSYALKNVHSSQPPADVAPGIQFLNDHKYELHGTKSHSNVDPSELYSSNKSVTEETDRQEVEKKNGDEGQQLNQSVSLKDSTRRLSRGEMDNSMNKSIKVCCDGSRNDECRHDPKNAHHGQKESHRDNEYKADSREKFADIPRRHNEREYNRGAPCRQERGRSRDEGRQTDYNESSKDQIYRCEELGDNSRGNSRGSSIDKSIGHNREDVSSRESRHRHDEKQYGGRHSVQHDRKHSSPESDASSSTSSDKVHSGSGSKRKSERLSTERQTWRIKLSSVTVNPAKKRREVNAGVTAEATTHNLVTERSAGESKANSIYVEEEKKLRKDHDEEYQVFKDMPEMHPDYEEVMEEFTKLYPAGDEDRRWKMYWNIKLETISETAWEEKNKDLIEKHKTATLQKNKSRVSSESPKSWFAMDDSQLVNSDNFSVAAAFDSLDDQTDELGVLGPPLRRLLRQARSAGDDTLEALTLVTNSDNATLIRMCVDKLRKLLLTAPQSKVLVLRRTALLADCLLTHAKKVLCKLEETRMKLLDLDLIAVAKATLGKGSSDIIKYIKSNLGRECIEYISKEEFNEVLVSVSSLHRKMMQDCNDFLNPQPQYTQSAPCTSGPGTIKESEIPLCLPAPTFSKRPPSQPQPETRRLEKNTPTDPWFVAEVRAIMDMPSVSVEIFNRSLCDIFSRKPTGYTFTKKDLSLANDLKQLTGFNLTESMFLFALKKILSELDDE